ncbi:MAG: hypothetical protein M1825_001682 [Sarcosagium campestre]|nr:MAG: hypothetical protein M1825_001682 [Sarcosagium campestre]
MRSKAVSPIFANLCIILFCLGPSAGAQIFGCDDVDCPKDPYNGRKCVVDNTTTSEIGVSRLNTSLSTQQLTWTIAVQVANDPRNDSRSITDRNFFLGTPPSLKLNQSSTKDACALFFEGVSSNLSFVGNDPGKGVGTCADALSAECVDDLVSQAETEMSKIIEEDEASSPCVNLETALNEKAPKSCIAARDGNWGTILVRELTGPSAVPNVEQGDCRPTTEEGYNLSLVASYRRASSDDDLPAIKFGVTPILTIIYGDSTDGAPAGAINKPEVQLSCLKPLSVENSAAKTSGPTESSTSDEPNNASFPSPTNVLFFAAAAIVSIFFFSQ